MRFRVKHGMTSDYKKSNRYIHPHVQAETDTGVTGITKIHANSVLPKENSKKKPLSREDKTENKRIASERATNEHAIGFIEPF